MQKCYSNHAYMHGYCSFVFNILLFFFSLLHLTLSFYLWFLTLTHWSSKQAMPLISKASSQSPCHHRSSLKLPHWCDLRSSLAKALVVPPPIDAEALVHKWVLGFWSFLILYLISFEIFCLISGFWGFDLFNSLFD